MADLNRLGKLEPLENPVEFIAASGGSVVSMSILDGTQLRWAFRERGVNPADNGWRFLGASDTSEYINTPGNSVIRTFNTVANIEPAVLAVYGAPYGTDVELRIDAEGRRTWVDARTGEPLAVPDEWPPLSP